MSVEFKKRHGTVLLVDDAGYIITSYHTLAFCFDKETGTVFNYGEYGTVQNWYDESKGAYTKAGFPEMANNLTIVAAEGYQWKLKDINAFIHTTGFILNWYRENITPSLTTPVSTLKPVIKDAEVL